MKHLRKYTLPKSLLTDIDDVPGSRSSNIERAVLITAEDPEKMVTSLLLRLQKATTDEEPVRVTITASAALAQKLDELSEKARLPVEHVLRLSLEAYIRSVGEVKQSQKERR